MEKSGGTEVSRSLVYESYREAWVEIDLEKIFQNIKRALRVSGVGGFFAVVKANAYGHGDIPVSSVALAAGAKKLCVATLDEALKLREAFPDAAIIILGAVSVEFVSIAADNNLEVTVFDVNFARALESFKGRTLKVHLKIDTGMNRLGLSTKADILEADRIIGSNNWLVKEGIFTHFHSADNEDKSLTVAQMQRFSAILELLDRKTFAFVHASNSAGMVLVNKGNKVEYGRLGILMYGINPSSNITECPGFSPAFSLKAKVVHIKRVKKGQSVGYSKGYILKKSAKIAILPIGYADGFWRYNEGRPVVIKNRSFTIVGRISMDQCMVEVDDSVKVGDVATLLGNEIKLSERAKELNTIPYELVCAISSRVPRRYFNNSTASDS